MSELDQTKNFVRVDVDGTHTDTDTEISIDSSDIDKLPDTEDGEYNLVWSDTTEYIRPEQDPNVEIVRVTNVDEGNNTITVERGQENTDASVKDTEGHVYQMILAPTAKMFEDINSREVEGLSTSGDAGTVPVSQGDNTLAMQEMSGGEETVTVSSNYTTQGESTVFVEVEDEEKTVTLASEDVEDGKIVRVMDKLGNAGENDIIIQTENDKTINGADMAKINTNYEALTMQSDSQDWFIVSRMNGGTE